MTIGRVTVKEIIPYMRRCGYEGRSLQEDYTYYDKDVRHKVEAVGFSGTAYNSATACIAVIPANNITEDKVLEYRSLGCPVVLACGGDFLEFWHYSGSSAVSEKRIRADKLGDFFEKHKGDFSPGSIYRAKTIGRVKKEYQLSFVDLGLMSIIEEQEGKYLSGLAERIIRLLRESCGAVKEDSKFEKWLFQAGFWLIGAKILKDKGVEGFKTLKISSVEDLVNKVQGHYHAEKKLDISNTMQRKALEEVAKIVEPVSSFAHLTTESLAYVYENTLTSKDTRKILGTHATPSWLVNYIVWELIDWIEAIPQKDRIILEPACGHAPFLTAGAKLLSSPLIYKGKDEDRHKYLKEHLIGIDKDDFAEEIARLALTLADIPNPNGWNIKHSDIYESDVLEKAAQKATILFCNPPFENYSPEEKEKYGNAIITGNKASEVLEKTLRYLPDNSVFGIILPQGFLHKKNLASLRRYILDNYELRYICNLPENVFAKSRHLSAVLLGRKIKIKKNITYLNITRSNLEKFKNTYQAGESTVVPKDELRGTKNCSFRILRLKDIWDYETGLVLEDICDIGKGLEYKGKDLPKDAITFREQSFTGSIEGFAHYGRNISITELPPVVYLNLSSEVIRRPQWGADYGKPQVLLNYSRVGSGPWRLKAWIDEKGHPVTSNFLVLRSKHLNNWSLNCIWALINSPYANAFAYCHNMERSNSTGIMRTMSVPKISHANKYLIDNLVWKYFSIFKPITTGMMSSDIEKEAKSILLEIDAEVLRLYNLPPRLEKQLLDFFAGYRRKGVDFDFDRYYPEDFNAYVPLRTFISEEFQNSTVENVKKWVDETRNEKVVKAWDNAVKAFEDDK